MINYEVKSHYDLDFIESTVLVNHNRHWTSTCKKSGLNFI